MAAIQNLPLRSVSLPSRLHPNSNRIESELEKLKNLEFSSASSISIGLSQLAELYNSIEEVIQSPVTQSALHHRKTEVEKALDGSISLIDACCCVRELILSMTEKIQDLQSAFRRKGKEYSRIETNINSYISFRKKFKKDISRNLKVLKKLEIRNPNASTVSSGFLMDRILEESRLITITIFKSLLNFLSTSDSNSSKWSVVARLMKGQSEKIITSEVGAIDLALFSLQEQVRKNDDGKTNNIQLVQRRLEEISCSLKEFEDGFHSLFRGLIQNRVTLLNILTP
ncbi:hypothetical protein ACFE04_026341 [Oxalis oulophora]